MNAEERRSARRRQNDEASQEIHWIAMQMAEQQRFLEEVLKEFNGLSTDLKVLISALNVRCPQHDKEIGELKGAMSKQEDDVKARMTKQDGRITTIEHDKYKLMGAFAALAAVGGFAGSWLSALVGGG